VDRDEKCEIHSVKLAELAESIKSVKENQDKLYNLINGTFAFYQKIIIGGVAILGGLLGVTKIF
jgi:hypothetical protein